MKRREKPKLQVEVFGLTSNRANQFISSYNTPMEIIGIVVVVLLVMKLLKTASGGVLPPYRGVTYSEYLRKPWRI